MLTGSLHSRALPYLFRNIGNLREVRTDEDMIRTLTLDSRGHITRPGILLAYSTARDIETVLPLDLPLVWACVFFITKTKTLSDD